MKELDRIKDEVAKENKYANWHHVKTHAFTEEVIIYLDEIAKRYAQLVAENALKEAAENATYKAIPDPSQDDPETYNIEVDKSSITDPKNVKLI